MDKIASAFVKAQKQFSPALKTSTNPHFRSKYADLSACVEAVIDSLNANGIALVQRCHDVDSGVKVETIFLHESGEQLSGGVLHVPASKNDAQGYGSALTYARRYALMAACGIAPEDDDGNAASKPKQKPALVVPSRPTSESLGITVEQIEAIRDFAMELIDLHANGGDIITKVASWNLDDDQKTALWNELPSNVRSALKKKAA